MINFFKKIKKEPFFAFIFSFVVFLLTYQISGFYLDGDQFHYHKVYDAIGEMHLLEAYAFYNASLSSLEIVHFIIVWSLSPYFEKNLIMAIFNAFLAYYSSRIMIRIGGNPIVVLIILIFSYYPLVLYFGAERLKFGFLLFFMAFWYFNNQRKKVAYYLAILSVLSHIQLIISFASLIAYSIYNGFLGLFKRLRINKTTLVMILSSFLAVYLMYNQILIKLRYYVEGSSILDFIKFFIIFFLTLIYSKLNNVYLKSRVVLIIVLFMPLLFVTFLMGTERTIIFGYVIFLYFALQVKHGLNLGVILTLMYGGYKSYVFVHNIFNYGHGFA